MGQMPQRQALGPQRGMSKALWLCLVLKPFSEGLIGAEGVGVDRKLKGKGVQCWHARDGTSQALCWP